MTHPALEANIGYLSREEQTQLGQANIVIVGTGGGGGPAAEVITRMGFGSEGGSITVTDPETFDWRNMNRQTGCYDDTIGRNKAEAVGELLGKIAPSRDIRVNTEGITEDNIEDMFKGADLIVDESAYELHHLGTMVARQARKQGIPVVSGYDVGFGGYVTTYHPEGPIFEEAQLGLSRHQSIEEIAQERVPVKKWAPYIPPYCDAEVFDKVAKEEISAPTIAPSATITAGLIATHAMLNIIGGKNHRPKPVYFDKAAMFDAMTHTAKVISFNDLSYYRSGARMLLRNKLGIVPKIG